MNMQSIERSYQEAKNRYAALGVNTDQVLRNLKKVPVSMHCWQGDDVGGFENMDAALGGGLAVTGNYPGQGPHARRIAQRYRNGVLSHSGETSPQSPLVLCRVPPRARKRNAMSLSPLISRAGSTGPSRSASGWISIRPCFAHPKAADGFTLSHKDKSIRKFWIEHCIACRKIGAAMGKALGTAAVTNVWIPDGMKDTPADRRGARERLKEALDEIFAEKISPKYNLDCRGRQAVRHRHRELYRRVARILPGLCCQEQQTGHPGCRALPPDRKRGRQDLLGPRRSSTRSCCM